MVGQGLSVGLNISATDIKGSSVGFARVDTTRSSDTFSSLAPGNFYLYRHDLHGQRVSELRAQQRAPDEQALARQQQALRELELREPPRCTGCMPHQADANANASTGTGTGTGPIPAAGQTAAGNTNPAWLAWQRAVQALQQDIQRLQGRLAALGQENIKAWDTLSRSPDSLHQPLLHTFDAGKATQEMRDGVAVTGAFGTQAYKAVGDWSKQQLKDAETACGENGACKKEANERWGEGGRFKVLLHGIVGTLATGTAGGVVGASLEALSPAITQAVVAAGFPDGTFMHNALVAGVKAAVGQGLDGSQTAAAMFNADANNRQLHPDIQRFILDPARVQRYMAERPGLSYQQAEQELSRTGAALNGSDWARVHADSVTELARTFLIKESVGRYLEDGSTYFTPSQADFENATKFLGAALKGDIFSLRPELLRARPAGAFDALYQFGSGGIDGGIRWIEGAYQDLTSAPESVQKLWGLLKSAFSDPRSVAAAIQREIEKAGPELRRMFQESQDMARLLELQGDVHGATSLATLGALTVLDPTGKLLKGVRLGSNVADGLVKSMSHAVAADKLATLAGQSITLPPLSVISRNDGLLGEALATQLSRELGVEVKVLQNASRHGVDLYAYDPTKNRYIVIEVKSSVVGSFGQPNTLGPERFLETRANSAAGGEGFWNSQNVSKEVIAEGKRIRDNFDTNRPLVTGYKFEVSLPSPGKSGGAPVITIKPWGP